MAYEEAALDALEKMAQEYDEKNKTPKSNLLVRFLHSLLCAAPENDDSDNYSSILKDIQEREEVERRDRFEKDLFYYYYDN